jgi:hypothetical protein
MHRHNTAISGKLAQSRCAARCCGDLPTGNPVEMGVEWEGEGGRECVQCGALTCDAVRGCATRCCLFVTERAADDVVPARLGDDGMERMGKSR